MTDDLMDARLHAAGDRWRVANDDAAAGTKAAALPEAATYEIEILAAPNRHRQHWITAASAALVAAAVVIGAVVLATHRNAQGNGTAAGPTVPSAQTNTSARDLVGTTWRLVAARATNGSSLPVDGTPTLRISSAEQLSGSDGCNAIFATVQVRSATIVFSQLGMTQVACRTPRVSATTMVDAVLSGTVAYSISGNELTLTNSRVGTLTYRAAPVSHPITDLAQLAGHPWTLTSTEHHTASADSSSSAVGHSVVEFNGTGGFTVQHRCYTNKGKATLAQGTARLSDVTLKLAVPCASNAESVQGQRENNLVDSVLTGTIRWSITGTQLAIARGNDILTFVRS